MHGYQPIVIPTATTVVAAQQMASGPPILPIARMRLYSAEEWEAFTNEWAHYTFQGKKVVRFSGAGDKGVDIAIFDPGQDFTGIWDAYQCKHYDNALRPSDIYVELGKVLWFSFSSEYKTPRSYTFIAPCGIGTKLNNLLMNPAKLKQELITNWEKHCRKEITSTQEIPLEGAFLAYFNAFDFTIFQGKQPLALIDEHKGRHITWRGLAVGFRRVRSRPARRRRSARMKPNTSSSFILPTRIT
ncbi:hypothetical protein [Bradyrhizobium sp. sGM-13]|uniref:hypothetical protein n=1 Tax=Bradyrhizobium sp. sGM-13 TaxID=2831781 RepID=UPI0020C0A034|nr:hypothetical protein [Bradyrhizobium sp. sGM-13]